MDTLDRNLIDLRAKLPHAHWSIGIRPATTSITWHYNGPPVDSRRQACLGLLNQLIVDATYQMRPGWGGTKDGAPGLMYHIVIGADGQVYQTADLDQQLWHCAHQDGNSHGLAIHCPIGGDQEPSIPMLASLLRTTEQLRKRYGIPLQRVYGHLEWKHATACPGNALMHHLIAYRAGRAVDTPNAPALPNDVWTCHITPRLTLPARIRTAPTTQSAITGRYKPGTQIYVEPRFVIGEAVQGDSRWVKLVEVVHQQAALGYISATLLELPQ